MKEFLFDWFSVLIAIILILIGVASLIGIIVLVYSLSGVLGVVLMVVLFGSLLITVEMRH